MGEIIDFNVRGLIGKLTCRQAVQVGGIMEEEVLKDGVVPGIQTGWLSSKGFIE